MRFCHAGNLGEKLTANDIVRALAAGGTADPYPLYADLHRLGEAVALTAPDLPYAATVHSYRAVDQLMRDVSFEVYDAFWLESTTPDWQQHPVLVMLMNSMMFSNGDQHARMRALFRKVFTPRRVRRMEPEIVRITTELLDRLAKLGADGAEVDYMAEFAYLLPARVVGRLLGLPDEDISWFRSQVDLINDWLDFRRKGPEVLAAADQAAAGITEYYLELIALRRKEPQRDLISDLVQAVDRGQHEVSDLENRRQPAGALQRELQHDDPPLRQRAAAAARAPCDPHACVRGGGAALRHPRARVHPGGEC